MKRAASSAQSTSSKPQPVKLGRTDSEFSEVVDGLAAGDSYAVKNSFILKAEIGKGEAGHDH